MEPGYVRPTFTPERIDSLQPGEIFVFGSNLNGYHGGGAARAALNHFGAQWGVGVGPQGQSYAIPTMQGGPETIRPYVDQFIAYAKSQKDLTFLVTPIGCGIAGFKVEDIAPLFKEALDVENIVLPKKFISILMRSVQPQLPDYLRIKTYGQTRTLVDMLIELNKTHNYTSAIDALKDLFQFLEQIRTDGDSVAFNCCLRNFRDCAHKCFVENKLDIKLLESFLIHDFQDGIEHIYKRYVIEKSIRLISYLNDFRQYTYNDIIDDNLYRDFLRATRGFSSCGVAPSYSYFSFSEGYIKYFLSRYTGTFWDEFSTNGILDNKLYFDFMIGRHKRGVEKYGLEKVIKRNFEPNGPCHPEVYFPYRGGAAPVYVEYNLMDANLKSSKRQFIKSCGEGKGPNSISDYFEFEKIIPLLDEDEKYILYGNLYLPKEDVSLPVFDVRWGRILFESPKEQAEFIVKAWQKNDNVVLDIDSISIKVLNLLKKFNLI